MASAAYRLLLAFFSIKLFSLIISRYVVLVDYKQIELVGWFVGFYGISTFVGYSTPNPFLCK